MRFKAKALAGVAAAAALAASATVIATTSQRSHSPPEAQKAPQEQSSGEGDGWVEAAIATQEARTRENEEVIDLGNLQPGGKGEGGDHGNERSQARQNARAKEDRGDGEGNERNGNGRFHLCHRTGSAKNPGVTITVNEHGAEAHLRNHEGDANGECATGRGHNGSPEDEPGP